MGCNSLAEHERSWHARLHSQAYSDFGVREPSTDELGYWVAVTGQIAYRACLFVFWLILNCCTAFLGVLVRPLWRPRPRFRFLQFPGGIPVISATLPILFFFCSYQTFLRNGAWHVILPFIAFAATSAIFFVLFAGINALRKRLKSTLDTAPQAPATRMFNPREDRM